MVTAPCSIVSQADGCPAVAGRTPEQRHLIGGRSLLWTVRTGAIAGPLSVVEYESSVNVLLHPKELVLYVWKADAQRCAAIGWSDVLNHSHLPGASSATLVPVKVVEK